MERRTFLREGDYREAERTRGSVGSVERGREGWVVDKIPPNGYSTIKERFQDQGKNSGTSVIDRDGQGLPGSDKNDQCPGPGDSRMDRDPHAKTREIDFNRMG